MMFPIDRTDEWDSRQDRAQAAECSTHAPEPADQLPNGETRERWTYWSSRHAELEKKYDEAVSNYSIADADAKRLQAQVDQMALELQEARNRLKPKCPDCNSVGMSHCAHPEECGGVYWPQHYVDRQIAEARQAGHREGFNAGLAAIRKYAGAYLNVNSSVMTPNQREGYHWVIEKSRALIDSPKAAPARRSPYDFACPRCSVARFETCIHDETLHGKEFHVSRRELADEANLKSIDSPKAEVEEQK